MKNKLTRIVSYAVRSGWGDFEEDIDLEITKGEPHLGLILMMNGDSHHYYGIKDLLFDHKFSGAVFGVKDMWHDTKCNCGGIDFHIGGYDNHHPDCKRAKSQRGYLFHMAKAIIVDPVEYYLNYICRNPRQPKQS